jgi:hypothetical protein
MSTIEQYEMPDTVKTLELAPLQLEILTHRDELDGEEINERFSWQDHANCREADQDCSSPDDVHSPARPGQYAQPA